MNKKHKYLLYRIIVTIILFSSSFFLPLNGIYRLTMYLLIYLFIGGCVICKSIKSILNGQVFNENLLMTIATVGAFYIGEYPEAVAVMLFYQVGEFFEKLSVERSRESIAELMEIRPDYANIDSNGELIRVSPYEVAVGDVIVVKAGEKVPLDGVVVSGESSVDTSSLTGESLPHDVANGDSIYSGSVNISSPIRIKVTHLFTESTVFKILELVENSESKKAKTEKFITVFARYYTPIVVILALLTALLPPIFTGDELIKWVERALIFLVVSCPCALVISIPLSFFGGIGGASSNGILIKGGNYLESLSKANTVVFDKTGTLTKGVFKVSEIVPDRENATEKDKNSLLELAALAESYSDHPIALSIKKEYNRPVDYTRVSDVTELPGYGITAFVDKIRILAGNEKLMKKHGIACKNPENYGTTVFVADSGTYIGYISISDEIKPESVFTISELRSAGVKNLVMLTGDSKEISEHVAEKLGIDRVYYELLPYEKVTATEALLDDIKGNGTLVYAGDGINDAPVLTRADIGIAMGGLGSGAAIEAADIVIMDDNPLKIVTAIKISRKTMKIVRQNIVFAIGVKVLVMVLGAFGIASMWEAVFADVGVSIIAVFNALRTYKVIK